MGSGFSGICPETCLPSDRKRPPIRFKAWAVRGRGGRVLIKDAIPDVRWAKSRLSEFFGPKTRFFGSPKILFREIFGSFSGVFGFRHENAEARTPNSLDLLK